MACHCVKRHKWASWRLTRSLSVDVGIPSNLTELGVKEDDIDVMVKHAQQDVCALTNPRRLNDKEVAAIFRAAM